MPVELKDLSFAMLILIMTAFTYYFFRDIVITSFCLIFWIIVYLETETGRLAISAKRGNLKLRDGQIPLFKEYHDVVKWWGPITLSLAAILTSFVFATREMHNVYPWALLTVSMYAISMIVLSFKQFLSLLIKEKTIGNQILFSGLLMLLFTAITAGISGSIAYLFGVPFFEDLIVAIVPLLIFDVFRLNFIRNAIFSVRRISEIEQAISLLSVAEKEYTHDPFLKKLELMKRNVSAFLEKSINLERQQSQVLLDLTSMENRLELELEKYGEITAPPPGMSDFLIQDGESIDVYGPFLIGEKFFYSAYYYRQGNLTTGFSAFDLKFKSLISDLKIAEKIGLCTIFLQRTSESKNGWGLAIMKKIRAYLVRSSFVLFDAFHRLFKWSFTRDLSYWLYKFENSERAKHEGLIGLDVTALLGHLVDRSILYINLVLQKLEQNFQKLHSHQTISSILEFRKRELALQEERLEIWEQRVESAKIVPSKVIGSSHLVRSCIKEKENTAVRVKQLKQWLDSLNDETRKLLDALRVKH